MKTQKGFTLIELMIVIVILGTLMATVVPKLTGAQARSRDAGRVADIGNISASLTTYYSDYGKFPDVTALGNGGECLDSAGAAGTAAPLIAANLKGGKVPADPSKTSNSTLCAGANVGRYWYKPLTKNGVSNNSYLLCGDAENAVKANAVAASVVAAADFNAAKAIVPDVAATVTAADTANASTSLFCVLGE